MSCLGSPLLNVAHLCLFPLRAYGANWRFIDQVTLASAADAEPTASIATLSPSVMMSVSVEEEVE